MWAPSTNVFGIASHTFTCERGEKFRLLAGWLYSLVHNKANGSGMSCDDSCRNRLHSYVRYDRIILTVVRDKLEFGGREQLASISLSTMRICIPCGIMLCIASRKKAAACP